MMDWDTLKPELFNKQPYYRPGCDSWEAQMIEHLRIRQLRLLVEIAESGTLAEAASRLNISQPAATKALQQLEAIFDTQLVVRASSGCTLEPAGQLLYEQAKIILGAARSVELEVQHLLTGEVGRAVVGVLPIALPSLLPKALGSLSELFPGLVVRLVPGDSGFLFEMLRSEQIDLLVGRLWPGEDPKYECVSLYSSEFVLIARAGHPIFDISVPDIAETLKCTWILPPLESHGRGAIEAICHQEKLPVPHCTVETTSFLATRELVRNSDMIAPIDRAAVMSDVKDGTVRAIDVDLNLILPPVGIMTLKRRQTTPAIERVKAAIIASVN